MVSFFMLACAALLRVCRSTSRKTWPKEPCLPVKSFRPQRTLLPQSGPVPGLFRAAVLRRIISASPAVACGGVHFPVGSCNPSLITSLCHFNRFFQAPDLAHPWERDTTRLLVIFLPLPPPRRQQSLSSIKPFVAALLPSPTSFVQSATHDSNPLLPRPVFPPLSNVPFFHCRDLFLISPLSPLTAWTSVFFHNSLPSVLPSSLALAESAQAAGNNLIMVVDPFNGRPAGFPLSRLLVLAEGSLIT